MKFEKILPRFRRGNIFLYGIAGMFVITVGYFLWPLPSALRAGEERNLRILDRSGFLLYEVESEESAGNLKRSDIPDHFIQALVATEDQDFFSHLGLSPRGILRAAWENMKAGKVVQGGSTITQQFVRQQMKPAKRNFAWKIREALLALKTDMKLSKEEILLGYLGGTFFGNRAYGLTAAAKTYFDKSVSELSLAESAYLVGLLKAPSTLNPFKDPVAAKARQELVLRTLQEQALLTQEELAEWNKESITLASGKVKIEAPHFVFWQLQNEQLKLDSDREIQTTLDLGLQKEIEGIIERHLETLAKQNVTNAAVVVLDAKTGEVLSMVGSADYFDAEHDGAVNAALSPRQPGSALKPFTYALALARGDTAATTVADIETQFFTQSGNPYIPRNYDYGYHGLVRYREALANSFNIAAVKVLEKVGVQSLLEFLRSAGLTTLTESPEHYGLALTLGDGEVKLLELAQAYAIFAREGKTLPIQTLRSSDSRVAATGEQILDPRVAWLIADILSDPEARSQEFGLDSPLTFDRPVAAKTGTTRNSRDNWTIGFTPERIVGVWVGNMDNSPMKDTSGITGAGPIFRDAMLAALRGIPPSEFARPKGLKEVTVCRLSGLLPSKYCPQTIREWFIDGTEPTKEDDLYRQIIVDRRNGLLGEGCPAPLAMPRVFAVFPPELKTWARENGWPQPPTVASPLCTNTPSSGRAATWIQIERPHAGDSFRLDPMIPDESEHVIFLASASDDIQTVEWFVDGKKVGDASAPSFRFEWRPSVGIFRVELRAKGVRDERTIEVTK